MSDKKVVSLRCSLPACRLTPVQGGRCAFHATQHKHGDKWARLCHPNSPANPDYKEPQGGENFRRQ